jgi:hypothetical protein
VCDDIQVSKVIGNKPTNRYFREKENLLIFHRFILQQKSKLFHNELSLVVIHNYHDKSIEEQV